LIKQAGLIDTDNYDKYEASTKLVRTLKRLQEVQCIYGFTPETISTSDHEELVITSNLQKNIE